MKNEKIIKEVKFILMCDTLKIEGNGNSVLDFEFYSKLNRTNSNFFNVKVIDISGVIEVRQRFFDKFKYLQSVNFCDNSLKKIDCNTFSNCTSLKNITIPNGTSKIGNYAFYNCTSLKEILIPDSVAAIEYAAFKACTSLKNITIPNMVTTLEVNVFSNCISLESVVIPDSVVEIRDSAFENCKSLENIIIPDSVVEIRDSAFENCKSLENIIIPNNVTKIGNYVFYGCDNLKTITISNNIKKAETESFGGANTTIVPLSGKFSPEFIEILCDSGSLSTEKLFNELFTNPSYFSEESINVLFDKIKMYISQSLLSYNIYKMIALNNLEFIHNLTFLRKIKNLFFDDELFSALMEKYYELSPILNNSQLFFESETVSHGNDQKSKNLLINV